MINRFEFFRDLISLLTPRLRKRIWLLFVIVLLSAGFEALGIGLILPFVSVVGSPEGVTQHAAIGAALVRLGLEVTQFSAVILVSALLAAAFVVKNLFLSFAAWYQARFTEEVYASTAGRLLSVYLAAPFEYHLHRNSGELIRSVTGDAQSLASSFLRPGVLIVSEFAIIASVGGLLVAVEPAITFAAMGLFALFAAVFFLYLRRRVNKMGHAYRYHHAEMIKWFSQGIGGLKEVKLLNREQFFVDAFTFHSRKYTRIAAINQFLQQAPRFLLEAIVVVAMVGLVLAVVRGGNSSESALPVLALFGAAMMRLMPSASRIIGALHQFNFSIPALRALQADMVSVPRAQGTQWQPGSVQAEMIPFERDFEISNLSFWYRNASLPALTDITFKARRGESIGIIGPSGAGKSTLVNILLGLLEPTNGSLRVDGRDITENLAGWQRHLGYIPQDIYLLDDTIRRNITFGLPDDQIDEALVAEAVTAARLDSVIAEQADGLDTVIGERGARLSGGQRQRIAIARALYRQADILVMDEAMSALDTETEREVSAAIERLRANKTIVMITHRLSSVRACDRIYCVDAGRITDVGSYEELISRNIGFRRLAAAGDT